MASKHRSTGIAEQFDMVPEVRWDELGPDALREAVIRVHNTVRAHSHLLARFANRP